MLRRLLADAHRADDERPQARPARLLQVLRPALVHSGIGFRSATKLAWNRSAAPLQSTLVDAFRWSDSHAVAKSPAGHCSKSVSVVRGAGPNAAAGCDRPANSRRLGAGEGHSR